MYIQTIQAKEVNIILADHGATRGPDSGHSLVDLQVLTVDLPEIQESDTMAIAKDKALLAAQLANGPCLVEDTSLKFNALGGMPGPYIKWFQDTLKSAGLYNILAAYEDKSAVAGKLPVSTIQCNRSGHTHRLPSLTFLQSVLWHFVQHPTRILYSSRENVTVPLSSRCKAVDLVGIPYSCLTNRTCPFRK